MAETIIEEKLESLRRCLDRVQDKCPATVEELEQNLDIQDVLVLNLSRAVQLCVDIAAHIISKSEQPAPATMGESFSMLVQAKIITAETAVQMRKAVGFRNIAVHGYETLNYGIVHAIATKQLEDFKQFARQVSDWSETQKS